MKKLFNKYKEPIAYLFFGGVATIISIGSFYLANKVFDAITSNIISWILAVLFQYYTNKNWVFAPTKNKSKFSEFIQFVSSRLFTLLIETAIIWLFVDNLHYNALLIKVIGEIIVIVGNYVLSKLWVFK